jgi:hypothetical protein
MVSRTEIAQADTGHERMESHGDRIALSWSNRV